MVEKSTKYTFISQNTHRITSNSIVQYKLLNKTQAN